MFIILNVLNDFIKKHELLFCLGSLPSLVLGQGERDYSKGVLDLKDNLHLLVLKPGVKPVVWECDLNSSRSSRRTVLNPLDNKGHELFLGWIGTYSIVLFSVLLIYF